MLFPTCIFASSPEVQHIQEQEARNSEGSQGTVRLSWGRCPSSSAVLPFIRLHTLLLLGLLSWGLQEGRSQEPDLVR